MNHAKNAWAILAALIFLSPAGARAWHGKGHDQAARFALAAMARAAEEPNRTSGEAVPTFLLAGADTVAHCSLDPDVFTRPIAPAALHDSESPEHYFDLELLKDGNLPELRYEYLDLCFRKALKPAKAGLLPYAVTEWTQRLTVALAEHRKWPEDKVIQQKCLVYAGLLAHYAADLCQPLHTTIHYDGRVDPDGNSPRSGIHSKVDALLGKFRYDEKDILKDLKVTPAEKLFPAVMEQVGRSNSKVDRVYELEKLLPDIESPAGDEPKLREFAMERMRACAAFTASLYLTAWRDSGNVKLPDWHKRK